MAETNDIFGDLMGNTGAPSDPPASQMAPVTTTGRDLFAEFDRDLKTGLLDTSKSATRYYNAAQVDPYSSQKVYESMGFNPYDSKNHTRFASAEDWGSTWEKTFDDFGYKFSNSFTEGMYSTGRMMRSIFTLGAYGMNAGEDDLISQYFADQQNELNNAIFLTPEDEEKFFNKKFVKDFVGNAGFTLGTLAEIALETAVTFGVGSAINAGLKATKGASALGKIGSNVLPGAITAESVETGLSAGARAIDAAAPIVTDAAAGLSHTEAAARMTKMGQIGEFGSRVLKDMSKTLGMNFSDVAKTRGLYNKIYAAAENLPVAGNALRTGREVAALANQGADALQMAKVGFNGFRRSLSEMSLAASESALESASAYGDAFTQMQNRYIEENNTPPDITKAENMRQTAMDIGSGVFNANMGILLTMNKIQFGNLFSKFVPTNKLVRGLIADEAGDAITTRVISNGIKSRAVEAGTVKGYKEIAETFGKKRAAWEVGKDIGRSMTKFEGSEGVQELLQESTSVAAKEYYMSLYDNNPMSATQAISKGVGEQMNEQGFKTFLIGAMTGRVVAPFTYAGGKISDAIYERVQGTGESRKQQEAQMQKHRDVMNLFFDSGRNGMKEYVANMKKQGKASEEMTEAAAVGNEYMFQNAKADSLVAAVGAAIRTNSLDAMAEHIRRTGQEFTEEDFKEAYGIDIADTKYSSVKQFSDKLAGDVETYGKTYRDLQRHYGPVVDPYIYPKDSKDFRRAMYLQNALHQAIDVVAANSIKGADAAERSKQVASDLSSIAELGSSSEYALRVLSNPKNLVAEIGVIQSELGALKQTLADTQDEALKEQIAGKEAELKMLNDWKNFWYFSNTVEEQLEGEQEGEEAAEKPKLPEELRYAFIGTLDSKKYASKQATPEELDEALKSESVQKLFYDILNLKNKQAGLSTTVSRTTVQSSISKIVDYIRLNRDAKNYMEAVDILMDPKNFRKAHLRFADGEFKSRIADAFSYIDNNTAVTIFEIELAKAFEASGKALNSENPGEFMEFLQENGTQIFNDIIEFIHGLESYKKLMAVYLSNTEGVEMQEYAQEQLKELVNEVMTKYNLKPKEPEVTDAKTDEENTNVEIKRINDDDDEDAPDDETPPAGTGPVPAASAAPVASASSETSVINNMVTGAPAPATTASPAPASQMNDEEFNALINPVNTGLDSITPAPAQTSAPANSSEEKLQLPTDAPVIADIFGFDPLFNADGTTVVDNNDSKVQETPAPEKAEAVATELNENVVMAGVARQYVGEGATVDVIEEFINQARDAHKKSRSKKSLTEYAQTVGGKKKLTAIAGEIKNAAEAEAPAEVTVVPEVAEPDANPGFIINMARERGAINLESLKSVRDKVQSKKTGITTQALQNQQEALQPEAKNVNFVIDGQISNDISEIFTCRL